MSNPFKQAERQYCGKGENLLSVGRLDNYIVLYKCFSKDGIENKYACRGKYVTVDKSGGGCMSLEPIHLSDDQ